MAYRKMPPADVAPLTASLQWTPDYFDFFKGIDDLDALSKVVFPGPDVTKSNVTRTINGVTATTYTFALTDAGNICEFQSGAATTVTIPTNATVAFPVGTQIDVMQAGGKVTFAGASGVTIKSVSSFKSLLAQDAAGTLVQMSANVWRLTGSLTA